MPEDTAAKSDAVADSDGHSRRSFFPLLMIAALVAGLLSGLAVHQFGNFFRFPPELQAKILSPNAQLDFQEMNDLTRQYILKNTTLCGALCGMLLAGTLGFAAGFCRSPARAAAGLGLGLLLGGVLGCLGGLAGATTWQHLVDAKYFPNANNDTTIHATIGNSIMWAAIGIATGAVAGIGGTLRKSFGGATAGFCGGVLAAWLFLFVAALAFPDARTGLPIPENLQTPSTTVARIVWALLPAMLIGLLVAVGAAPVAQESAPESDTGVAKEKPAEESG